MKCPVCKNECGSSDKQCKICGFSELTIAFLNKEDAEQWENSVLKQCRNVYHKLKKKIKQYDDYPLVKFDYPRRGCNVKIIEPHVPDEYYGTIVYADKTQIHLQIPGKLKAIKFAFKWSLSERQIEEIALRGYRVVDENQIFYIEDEVYKQEKDWQENLSKSLRNGIREKEPFRESYDAFVKEHINLREWCFDADVIHYHGDLSPNTYFCAYDNPPFEVIYTNVKKDNNHYTIEVRLRNLSNETRNQPIKFRYRIAAPSMNMVYDWTDTVTPAPKYQTAVIHFEYNAIDKPYFEIIN